MIVATIKPVNAPEVITILLATMLDSMPELIPTIIPMMLTGIIISNAPKTGMSATLSIRAMVIPINPPASMGMKEGEI